MLWDTSVFVDYLRNFYPITNYLNQVRNGAESGYCSVMTEAELWAGNRNQQEEVRAASALSIFTIIDVDSNIARLAGTLLNRKSPEEKKAHMRDALIAATAITLGETVLTADGASQRVFGNSVNYLVYR